MGSVGREGRYLGADRHVDEDDIRLLDTKTFAECINANDYVLAEFYDYGIPSNKMRLVPMVPGAGLA